MKLCFRDSSRFAAIGGNMTSDFGYPEGVFEEPNNGVAVEAPKSSFVRPIFLNALFGNGEPETGGNDARFEGVSGI
jgi:hypothetical protein